jgi:hypothetical protein
MRNFNYPPIPSPWNSETRTRVSDLLQQVVYGPCPVPTDTAVESAEPIEPDVEILKIPFPVHFATPADDGPWPCLAGLSFQKLDALDTEGAWPISRLTANGWAIAIAYAGDIEPDDAARSSGHALAKWANGIQTIAGAIRQSKKVIPEKIVAIGHSRFGKAALLAAGMDDSLAGVVGIQSGCGGAAPSRTEVGETVEAITKMFPHWFAPEFAQYADNPESLPLDQHWLLSLCANRPVLLCNADQDTWANPMGQHRMLQLAAEAHGETVGEMVLGNTVGSGLAHFYRQGKHEVIESDWDAILAWLSKW